MNAEGGLSHAHDWNPYEAPAAQGETVALLVDAFLPRLRPAWVLVSFLGLFALLLIVVAGAILYAAGTQPPGPAPAAGARPPTGAAIALLGIGGTLLLLVAWLRSRLSRTPPTLRFYREGIELRIRLQRRWRLALFPFPARLPWSDLKAVVVNGRFLRRRLVLVADRLVFERKHLRGGAMPPFWVVRIDAHQFAVPIDRVRQTVQTYGESASIRAGLASWENGPALS